MLRRQSVTVIRHTTSHLSPRPRYFRHQPLSVRSAVRPTSRSSHHPTNLPQIFPRSPSPSRRNSTLSANKAGFPSKRMRFVRRFVETVDSPFSKNPILEIRSCVAIRLLMRVRLRYRVLYLGRITLFKLVKLQVQVRIPICEDEH